jgi:enoyl-CoA hydratase/carnithine racemase
VILIESDARGGSVEDLADLVPADEVVAIVCHGIIGGVTDPALPATQIVLALNGQLVDGALSVAAQSSLILASDRGSFLDRGREAGGSYAVVLQARLPIGEVARMSLTAQPLAASDAERVGLVDRLVDTKAIRQEAIDAAHLVADISSA